jgi:hypothetical protein
MGFDEDTLNIATGISSRVVQSLSWLYAASSDRVTQLESIIESKRENSTSCRERKIANYKIQVLVFDVASPHRLTCCSFHKH